MDTSVSFFNLDCAVFFVSGFMFWRHISPPAVNPLTKQLSVKALTAGLYSPPKVLGLRLTGIFGAVTGSFHFVVNVLDVKRHCGKEVEM